MVLFLNIFVANKFWWILFKDVLLVSYNKFPRLKRVGKYIWKKTLPFSFRSTILIETPFKRENDFLLYSDQTNGNCQLYIRWPRFATLSQYRRSWRPKVCLACRARLIVLKLICLLIHLGSGAMNRITKLSWF